MVEKNKNSFILIKEKLENVVSHLGVAVMLAATVVSIVEIAERESSRLVTTLQPAYVHAGSTSDIAGQAGHSGHAGQGSDQAHRGKEEIRHAAASYGELRRQHFVAGTV
ncbi:MAG TPA: hypothetical protein VF575_00550 [Candidatus Saccharimonadales bacterium]|jgi:hypothetical protein